MEEDKRLQREAFIETLHDSAKTDKDIYFLSADFGSSTLEKKFIPDFPEQFIHTGIAEQALLNIALGLSLNGRKPYSYAMDCFVTLRCLEQAKVAAATLQLHKKPYYFTIVGVGSGFGYNDAGPTHYTTESIPCMRSIAGLKFLSPSDNKAVVEAAKLTLTRPGMQYVRLDRQNLPKIYGDDYTSFVVDGMSEIAKGEDVLIVTTGYTTHQAVKAREELENFGIKAGIVDIFQIEPFNGKKLASILNNYRTAVSWEEHFINGGLGSIVAETIVDNNLHLPLRRIAVPQEYYFENDSEFGGRKYLHKRAGIDYATSISIIREFIDSYKSAHPASAYVSEDSDH